MASNGAAVLPIIKNAIDSIYTHRQMYFLRGLARYHAAGRNHSPRMKEATKTRCFNAPWRGTTKGEPGLALSFPRAMELLKDLLFAVVSVEGVNNSFSRG